LAGVRPIPHTIKSSLNLIFGHGGNIAI
jgi:hypothetical protein